MEASIRKSKRSCRFTQRWFIYTDGSRFQWERYNAAGQTVGTWIVCDAAQNEIELGKDGCNVATYGSIEYLVKCVRLHSDYKQW